MTIGLEVVGTEPSKKHVQMSIILRMNFLRVNFSESILVTFYGERQGVMNQNLTNARSAKEG